MEGYIIILWGSTDSVQLRVGQTPYVFSLYARWLGSLTLFSADSFGMAVRTDVEVDIIFLGT